MVKRRRSIGNPYLRSLAAAGRRESRINRWNASAQKYAQIAATGDPKSFARPSPASGMGAYRVPMYTGHGGYKKTFGKFFRSRAFKNVGNALIKEGIQHIGGRGAYGNSLIQGSAGADGAVPVFSSVGDETGALTITHREYVTDAYAPGIAGAAAPTSANAFSNQSYSLNPGLEQSFPWLSQIAANYEEYSFVQLMYTYRSTTTDIGSSTTGQCGTMIMATNYNSASPAFGDKITMMEYDGAMSCKVTNNMHHGIECDPEKLSGSEGKYVRTNPVPTGQDVKTYDHGLFQFAFANTPKEYNGFSLGEIWVSYTVTLKKPRFYVNRGLAIDQDVFIAQPATGITSAAPMGTITSLLRGQQNNIGCQVTNGTNAIVITFPAQFAGQVRVVYNVNTNAALGTVPGATITLTGNVVQWADIWINNAWVDKFSSLSAASTSGYLYCDFRVSAASGSVNNTVTISSPGSLSGNAANSAFLQIYETNGGFSSSNSLASMPMVNPSGVVTVPV